MFAAEAFRFGSKAVSGIERLTAESMPSMESLYTTGIFKFNNEMCKTGALWPDMLIAKSLVSKTNHAIPNLKLFPEIIEGNSGERAWAKSLIEGEADLKLVGKLKRGTNGAWLARSEQGENRIFKFVSNEDVRTQLKLSADSARAVDSALAHTPQYRQIGFSPYKGSWYTQEFLPGYPAPAGTCQQL